MMTKTEQIMQIIQAAPGVTVAQVAKQLGCPRDQANALLRHLWKTGRAVREEVGVTITNRTFYGYYPAASPTVQKPSPTVQKPRKASTPSRTQTNATTLDLNALVEWWNAQAKLQRNEMRYSILLSSLQG